MPTSSDKLSNARKAFDSWRNQSSRKRNIPDQLWQQAVALLEEYTISRVATELRLNQARLREKQAAFKPPLSLKKHTQEQTPFIELNQSLPITNGSSQTDSSTLRLLIERRDGTTLTLYLNSSHEELVQALLTAFIRS